MTDGEVTDDIDVDDVGGLGEVLPEPLVPIYERLQLIQQFRENYGPTYTTILEAIIAALLIGGYLYWLFLFFVIGS